MHAKRSSKVPLGLFIGIFIFMALSTGCEPLRKKFTRKKKEDVSQTEFVPVLDPVDYPDKKESPEQIYKLHYSLWQVWYKDYAIAAQENSSDKKIFYTLNQLLAQVEEMQKVLRGEKQQLVVNIGQQVQNVITQYKTPRGVRDDAGLRQQVMSVDKKLRNNLKFEYVKDNLVTGL